jgi:hypothetical protein
MWSFDSTKAKLDLSKIRSDFRRISDQGLIFIHPKKNMWDWDPEERFLRSVVVDENGYVVSCGWPKFGNYGEFLDDTEKLKSDLESGAVVRFSHKEDGSLLIRSVINGEVILRTRGTISGGERGEDNTESYKEKFFRVAQKYPKILDKEWMTDRSLLFEYVAPSNRVVIQYKEEDLIFLGFVDHLLHIGSWNEVEKMAEEGQLNIVRLHNLPRDPMKLLEIIKIWKDEGVVARCYNDQVFVKIKSAHYLAQHRMRFSINYKFMVEFIELSGIKTEEDLIRELKVCNYDYEIIETTLPFYHRYQKVVSYIDGIISEASQIVDTFSSDKTDEAGRRKDFALIIKQKDECIRPFAFAMYDNKLSRTAALRHKIILTEGKK